MAHIIVDRRKNDRGKSSVNRKEYVRRVRESVREAVKDTVRDGNIKDIISDKSKRVKIPDKGLSQPDFHHSRSGGINDRVFPGNKEFQQGDRINRPQGGQGGQGDGEGSSDGEGEDEFTFTLTREEFLDVFFEDLELPDMVKKDITKTDDYVSRRAGFTTDGPPARMNTTRTMRHAKSRRTALRAAKRKELRQLEEELEQLEAKQTLTDDEQERKQWVEDRIEALKRKIGAIPFIDDVDLRYNHWEKQPVPSTQAVMFCLMDASASMGEWEKEMAKRFFMLLYLFLERQYERVEIVFIRHTQIAKEVDEDEFFQSRETGGTVVSSALEKMKNVIDDRYPTSQWNIFACQASDGDNWPQDLTVATQWMTTSILPLVQYFAYVEIDQRGRPGQSDLWPYYEGLANSWDNFSMQIVDDASNIYPVFRKLFEKKERSV